MVICLVESASCPPLSFAERCMKSRLDNMTGFVGSGREAGSRGLRSGMVYILLASR